MKKVCLGLMAALCAGFASAINVTWDWQASQGNGFTGGTAISTPDTAFDFSKAITVSLTYTIQNGPPANNTVYFALAFNSPSGSDVSTGTNSIVFRRDSSGNAQFVINGSNATAPTVGYVIQDLDSSVLDNGEHSLAITFIPDELSTVHFELDSATWDVTAPTEGLTIGDEFTLRAQTGAKIHVSDVSATGVLLPEPTALALLALGVAGVALRRRVA